MCWYLATCPTSLARSSLALLALAGKVGEPTLAVEHRCLDCTALCLRPGMSRLYCNLSVIEFAYV